VAGYGPSPNYTRARNVAHEIAVAHPEYETWFYGPSRAKYFEWLPLWKATLTDDKWKDHRTAPIVWFEKSDGSVEVIGGRDMLCEWTMRTYPESKPALLADSFFVKSGGVFLYRSETHCYLRWVVLGWLGEF